MEQLRNSQSKSLDPLIIHNYNRVHFKCQDAADDDPVFQMNSSHAVALHVRPSREKEEAEQLCWSLLRSRHRDLLCGGSSRRIPMK